VILDELGRGTSTHDGVSIAYATLRHIVENVQCFCLFVTHYVLLCELELEFPARIRNFHMAYLEHERSDTETDEDDQPPYGKRHHVSLPLFHSS